MNAVKPRIIWCWTGKQWMAFTRSASGRMLTAGFGPTPAAAYADRARL